MVHILPHWNWEDEEERKNVEDSEGKIPIRVYSNAKSVELFLNGKSLGKKTFSTKKQLMEGNTNKRVIQVIIYIKNGESVINIIQQIN